MRRRIKLLVSILALGFSFALMTFGVFAATSHTLTISSTVSFSIGQNIMCEVNGKTFRQTAAPKYSYANVITTLTESKASMNQTELSQGTWTALTAEQGKMTIDEQAIYWVFEVKNTAAATANNFKVGVGVQGSTADSFTKLTLPTEISASYNLDITYGTSNAGAPATAVDANGWTNAVAPQNSIYVMVKVSPKSINTNIASKAFNFTLVMAYSD